MIQETRKDPRAKVLSVMVRYKSATIDEFIEHHSHDVSRGGMFVKTPSPFPAGTLLKFEVRLAEEQKVIQGVGRVVWKREASASAPDSPTGMGVKFIKLDDESKQTIDRLIGSRGQTEGAFDAGQRVTAAATPAAPVAPAAPAAAAAPTGTVIGAIRKGTMIGLGSMKIAEAPAPARTGGAFFPESGPQEARPEEERTVMLQATELLREALREAGGSMDEVGTAESARAASPAPAPTPSIVPLPAPIVPAEPSPPKVAQAEAEVAPTPAPAPEELPEPPKAEVAPPAAPEAPPEPPKAEVAPPRAEEEAPPAVRAPAPRPSPISQVEDVAPPVKQKGGSKSAVWMLLGVAALGGAIFAVAQTMNKPAPAAPPAAPEPPPRVVPAPPPPAPVAPPAPTVTAQPEATAPAAPAPTAAPPPPETPAQKAARERAAVEAAKKADAEAKKAEATAKKAEADARKAAEAEARQAAREAAAARAAAAMKAAAAAPAPPRAAPAPAPAPAEKPAAPAPKPPAPKPAAPPKAPESDNPY